MDSSPTTAAEAASPPSYWCYSCECFVRAAPQGEAGVVCPDCDRGFLEEMAAPRFPPKSAAENELRPRFNWRAAASGDRSSYNLVIVLRHSTVLPGDDEIPGATSSFELFYDDGAGSGLRTS